MAYTTLIFVIVRCASLHAEFELNEQARKAQDCPIVAKGKGYAYYAIPQDGGFSLVHLESQTGKMRKIFAPGTSEFHDPFRGMPIHYHYTTGLVALAVDDERIYLLTGTLTEDLSRGRRGLGIGGLRAAAPSPPLPPLPDQGPLAVTRGRLSIKMGLVANTTYRLQIYWRQDASLLYSDETTGGDYVIDGKSVKKKGAAK